jgi:ADP-ribose pyrophosphatase YjhB (NUDIX family)
MSRIDHYNDPEAPAANSLLPGGSAIVVDDEGHILLQRRADSGLWALPGGLQDIGETIGEAVTREVEEETGLHTEITSLVGIYTDPRHVMEYADGEVRQQFNVCFAARVVGGRYAPATSPPRFDSSTPPSSTAFRCTRPSGCGSSTSRNAVVIRTSAEASVQIRGRKARVHVLVRQSRLRQIDAGTAPEPHTV